MLVEPLRCGARLVGRLPPRNLGPDTASKLADSQP